uniref:Uncharacterized protein n=1 Tax=Anguilla anguilla TaxID=7936 RepID=A0A0E9X134_ANGAN
MTGNRLSSQGHKVSILDFSVWWSQQLIFILQIPEFHSKQSYTPKQSSMVNLGDYHKECIKCLIFIEDNPAVAYFQDRRLPRDGLLCLLTW